jgi:hypothetical protein
LDQAKIATLKAAIGTIITNNCNRNHREKRAEDFARQMRDHKIKQDYDAKQKANQQLKEKQAMVVNAFTADNTTNRNIETYLLMAEARRRVQSGSQTSNLLVFLTDKAEDGSNHASTSASRSALLPAAAASAASASSSQSASAGSSSSLGTIAAAAHSAAHQTAAGTTPSQNQAVVKKPAKNEN